MLPGGLTSARARVRVVVNDRGWFGAIANPTMLAARAAAAVGGVETVVLASDRLVRRLNSRHRGRNKPTNVLSYPGPGPGMPGEIVLALGVIQREAEAAGRSVADHLAHLVVHGALHLSGHEHEGAGAARRMEMAEARILARLGVGNPWRRA
jgi:probable rRNA maturation factor